MTFTLVRQPPSEVQTVNALDLVTCALLLGAPVVVAMENPDVFSEGSRLIMCLRLFDTRPGGRDADAPAAVSSDLNSWGSGCWRSTRTLSKTRA